MDSIQPKKLRLPILEEWLREWALGISLVLALAVSLIMGCDGVVSEDFTPFGDGEHYVLRGLTLYGYLHTGQWAHFWETFTFPKQSLAPLHYWIFFLLPKAWASMTAYGVILVVTTYVMLATGSVALCRVLDRTEWAPALFLFCAWQNISLDESYFYFADVPFMAAGVVAFALQVKAWRDSTVKSSVWSGIGLGFLFWVKAPNAIIFTATFVIAEMIHAVLTLREAKATLTFPHVLAVAAGALPPTLLALACGGFQSIIRQVNQNEVSNIFATTLECTGLLRLFYFPLCLSYFYHVVLVIVVLVIALICANKWPLAPSAFPIRRLLPLIVAYVVLGEFFSFGEASKGMRSLLILLPVFWLTIFWALERWRVRPAFLFLAGAIYATCASSQVLFNTFGTSDLPTEGYQLKGDWLGRLPQVHLNGPGWIEITKSVLGMVRQGLPDGGKVAVGSEKIALTAESLSWMAQHQLALQGQPAPNHFENFIAFDGKVCRSALLDSRGVILYLSPQAQYSREVYQFSVNMANYVRATWGAEGYATATAMGANDHEIFCALILFKTPLDDARITQLIQATHAVELPADSEFNPPVDHRLDAAETWDILRHWAQKRLGLGAKSPP